MGSHLCSALHWLKSARFGRDSGRKSASGFTFERNNVTVPDAPIVAVLKLTSMCPRAEFPMAQKAKPQTKPAKPIEKVAFVSLGCPKNLVDSERMLGLLAEDGLAITPDASDADAIVINTCGFLEASKTESLQEIRDAVRMKHEGKCRRVIVAGCLVQRHKTKLLADAPGIDRLVGVFDREHIVEAVRGKENPRQEHGHFLGKYHDLTLKSHGSASVGLPVFEDDRARLRLT